MDTLFHGVVGAALCSRTGLAGGRRGPVDGQGRRRFSDWTLWAAFGFGVLPDLASLGIHFSRVMFFGGGEPWGGIPDVVFVLYDLTHSLAGMAVCVGALAWWRRPLGLPALAWPIHVLMDVPTHGDGRFMTPILWPFSDWTFSGWSWWLHPGVFQGGWILAGGLVVATVAMRWSGRGRETEGGG